MTAYRIFRFDPQISAWTPVGEETASNPKQALRLLSISTSAALDPGRYAVVPARNWTELTPELKTETRLVF